MNLFAFIEILGYIAISLMVLQVILTIGLTALTFCKDESSESRDESTI